MPQPLTRSRTNARRPPRSRDGLLYKSYVARFLLSATPAEAEENETKAEQGNGTRLGDCVALQIINQAIQVTASQGRVIHLNSTDVPLHYEEPKLATARPGNASDPPGVQHDVVDNFYTIKFDCIKSRYTVLTQGELVNPVSGV